jgi:TIR domain
MSVIEKELESAKAVIVLWSEDSIQSDWVRAEADLAKVSNKLVPLAIKPVRPPLGFGALHTLQLYDWDGSPNADVFQALLKALVALGVNATKEGPTLSKQTSSGLMLDDEIYKETAEDIKMDAEYIDVFVAYSRLDTKLCEDFIIQVRRQELEVFYDQFIRGGQEWREMIARNILGCAVFVVILSNNSVASQEVKNELNLAIKHGKKIIPLLVEPVELPGSFDLILSGLNYIEAFNDFSNKFLEAAETAKTLIAVEAFDARKRILRNSRKVATSSRESSSENLQANNRRDLISQSAIKWYGVVILVSLTASVSAVWLAVLYNVLPPSHIYAAFGVFLILVALPYSLLLTAAIKKMGETTR